MSITKARPNQTWQGQDGAHSLITIVRSTVLPYLIGSYFSVHGLQSGLSFLRDAYLQTAPTWRIPLIAPIFRNVSANSAIHLLCGNWAFQPNSLLLLLSLSLSLSFSLSCYHVSHPVSIFLTLSPMPPLALLSSLSLPWPQHTCLSFTVSHPLTLYIIDSFLSCCGQHFQFYSLTSLFQK